MTGEDYPLLRDAIDKLHLNDASFTPADGTNGRPFDPADASEDLRSDDVRVTYQINQKNKVTGFYEWQRNGKTKQPRSGKIHWVCDTVREDEKSGKDVARQSRQKKVQEHRPSRPS